MTATGIVIRLAALLAVVLLAGWAVHALTEALDLMVMPHNERAVHRSIMLATAVFIVLLAIPFVPGAEIGLTMLTVFGAAIAPLVYGATVTALMLAFLVGRFLPPTILARTLRLIRLKRAADFIEDMADLPREARVARLMESGSPRLARLATRYRYLAVLLAINLPGNVLIGGGGGIAMIAGMSGLFAPLPFLLTVAVAVAPVPLVVAIWGA